MSPARAGKLKSGASSPGVTGGRCSEIIMRLRLLGSLAEKRQNHERIRLDAGARANLLRLRPVRRRALHLADVEVERSEAVVAGKEELRLSGLFSQAKCLLVGCKSESVIAMALMDLTEHDQRHRQVVQQPEPTVEVDSN